MSLVGPRPLVPDEDRKIEGWQRRRTGFRPLYGANWSVWRDLKILARTVPVVVGRRGL
jgi:lipopolysaccharide/colanic/teichoic acid biosynthesis glycosyltransferase